jgi:hypothetical protein
MSMNKVLVRTVSEGPRIEVDASTRCVRVPAGATLTHLTQINPQGTEPVKLRYYDNDEDPLPQSAIVSLADCKMGERVWADIGETAPRSEHIWEMWELVEEATGR